MVSRLKKISNHTNPQMNSIIEDIVVNRSFNNTNENQTESFLLTKKLFAITTFSPTGALSYDFAKRIEDGYYEHLGPIEDAEGNLEEWLLALNEFLNEQEHKVLIANLKKKVASQNNLYGDGYTDTLFTDNYLDMNKDSSNVQEPKAQTSKEDYISTSFSLAKDLINGLPIVPRYDLMSQLAQDIERGSFDDISDNENAKNNWQAWLDRARSILRSRNIILSSRLKK